MTGGTSEPRSGTGSRWLFLRFATIAGCGWLLDAGLLLAMVTLAGLPAGIANVISSCTAAISVFLVSRQRLFARAEHHFLLRVAGYLAYTLLVILVASVVVGWLVRLLSPLIESHVAGGSTALLAAAMAKVIVTPPQLLCNFFTARFLSERTTAAKA